MSSLQWSLLVILWIIHCTGSSLDMVTSVQGFTTVVVKSRIG